VTESALAVPPPNIRRVAFLGTPLAAVPCLEALVGAGFEVVRVVSQPDRRRGRGSTRTQSAVKQAAVGHGIPVGDDLDELLELDLDLAVVVAFGRIIPRRLLQPIPMVNVHFSLLPRWRGAAPVERAILAGDDETGVCIIALAEGLDEGDVYACETVAIEENESASALTDRLAVKGADLLSKTLDSPLPQPVPQGGEGTYAKKIARTESELDFDRPAVDLHRQVRALPTWTRFRGRRFAIEETRVLSGRLTPGEMALTTAPPAGGDSSEDVSEDQRNPTVVVGTASGLLELRSVKPEGKRTMDARDWWHGAQPDRGNRLGC